MRTYVIFFVALLLWSAPAFGELSQREIQAIGNAAAAQVKTDLSEIKTEIGEIRTEISAIKVEISTVKAELSEMKVELSAVRTELSETRAEVSEMKGEIRGQSQRITDQRTILIALFSLVLLGGGFLYRQLNKLQESVQRQQETIAVLEKTYELLKPQTAIHQGKPLETSNVPEPAETYYGRGNAYYDEGKFDSAIAEYTSAITLKRDYAEAYYGRGNAYYDEGKFDSAIAEYTSAITLKRDYAEAYYGRGIAYYDEGKFDRVICDFDKVIELKSDSGGANRYCYRGFALLHKGEWDKAKADLTVAKDRGVDIIASFQNDYESVADFEKKNGVTVPEDIKEMLTPA